MKVFFDTSVLIAAFWLEHPGHKESLAVFSRSGPERAYCGLHTLGEFYSSITALPIHNRFDPQTTLPLIMEIRTRCTPVSLTEKEYVTTIETAANNGFKSGMIYDALLLRCAEKSGAEVIYTWNLKHFRMLAPALADKIRTP